MIYDLTPSVILLFSATQEKFVVEFVVVIGIAAGVKFHDYFCSF